MLGWAGAVGVRVTCTETLNFSSTWVSGLPRTRARRKSVRLGSALASAAEKQILLARRGRFGRNACDSTRVAQPTGGTRYVQRRPGSPAWTRRPERAP